MPDGEEKQKMMAQMKATQDLMTHTKEKMMKAMREGTMFGQPFLHVMFGDPDIQITHH